MCSLFVFALALSLDGFGMGLSYGLRKIKIRLLPLIIICFSSAIAIIISMIFGKVLSSFLSNRLATVLGALILIMVGLWIILQNHFLQMMDSHRYRSEELQGSHLKKMLNILQEPVRADLNRSGEIDLKEAVWLGAALAMDALGAGLGAAMSGYSQVWTPLVVAVVEFMMINLGFFMGEKLCIKGLKKRVSLLPGGIIIVLGLTKLIVW